MAPAELGYHFGRDQALELPLVLTKERAQGAVYIVTGSNTGLGYEAAKHLVQLSCAKVILAVRNQTKGDETLARLEAETGVKGIAEAWPLEMGVYDSIKAFADRVKGLERLDGIVENAAVALANWSVSDGLETTLIVNVTGTMLLAGLVMPKLKESAKKFGILPHISIIGSGVAFTVPGVLEGINGDFIESLNNESNGIKDRYQVSKLLLFYAVREYALRNPVSATGVVVNYVNPGLCVTELDRHVPEQIQAQINALRDAHGRTAEMGSRTLIHGAVGGVETHGKYVSECEIKEHYIPEWITNESGQKMQKRAWETIAAHVNKVSPGCL